MPWGFLGTPVKFSDRCWFTEAAVQCNKVKAVDDLVSISLLSTEAVENSPFGGLLGEHVLLVRSFQLQRYPYKQKHEQIDLLIYTAQVLIGFW